MLISSPQIDADDLGPGDQRVALSLDHEDVVHQGSGVDGQAGGVAHDPAELRHHARRAHVLVEEVGAADDVADGLLDAGARRLHQGDDRHARLDRQIDGLGDLAPVEGADGPPEHRDVLGVGAHHAPLDLAVARDHAVARHAPLLHAELVPLRLVEHPEFHEAAWVEQHVEPLARSAAAPRPPASRTRPRTPGRSARRLSARSRSIFCCIRCRSSLTLCSPSAPGRHCSNGQSRPFGVEWELARQVDGRLHFACRPQRPPLTATRRRRRR